MKTLKNKTILIVDDEPMLREIIAQTFIDLGCKVLQAENGVRALELAEKEKIHVIISDVQMPGGNGVDLLKGLSLLKERMPVTIMISGFSHLSEKEAMALGAIALLPKPFGRDALIELIEKGLNS